MLTKVYKDESSAATYRRLASVPVITDEASSASLFCWSLLIVLLSLELMLITHKGVTTTYQLLVHEIETFHMRSLNWSLLKISLLKVCIFIFT